MALTRLNSSGAAITRERLIPGCWVGQSLLLALFLALAPVAGAERAMDRADDVAIPQDLLTRIDEFERQAFAKPEALFAKGRWKEAIAGYDAYCLQFPKSDLVAFAYMRKGRCQEAGNDRLDAIKTYQEVLDYFPNLVSAAAPALYLQGKAHFANGDDTEALRSWTKMAADPAYSQHPLAAQAVNALGDYLIRKDKAAQAIPYFTQIAIDFRESNAAAAYYAIQRIVTHYVRTGPDEDKLRELYVKAGGFSDKRIKTATNPIESREYWSVIMSQLRDPWSRKETPSEALLEQRRKYSAYWAGRMQGRFPDWDDFQINLANYSFLAEGEDATKWTARLDGQYANYQKPGDDARTLRWMRLFVTMKAKVQEYHAKLDFARMSNPLIRETMEFLYNDLKEPDLGRNVALKLRLPELDDAAKESLASYFWRKIRDPEMAARFNADMADKERAKFGLFTYYAQMKDIDKALPLADELINSERYAASAAEAKGLLLFSAKRFPEAIEAYRRANLGPAGAFVIAKCYTSMSKIEAAVEELSQVENLVPQQAPKAALAIANIYRDAGDPYRKQMIAAYRKVIAKYKGTTELSLAHVELEKRNIASVEAVEADDEKNPGNK